MFNSRFSNWIPIVCFGLGLLAAQEQPVSWSTVTADEKKSPEAFLSGGARSEKVLVEILATLRTLDERVAGIQEQLKGARGTEKSAEPEQNGEQPKVRSGRQ